jgi:hypothetical protein
VCIFIRLINLRRKVMAITKKGVANAVWGNRTHGERAAMVTTLLAAVAFGAPAIACKVGVSAACVVGDAYMAAITSGSTAATASKSLTAAVALFGAGKLVDAMTGNAPQQTGYTALNPSVDGGV